MTHNSSISKLMQDATLAVQKRRFAAARIALAAILETDPGNREALHLLVQISDRESKNSVTASDQSTYSRDISNNFPRLLFAGLTSIIIGTLAAMRPFQAGLHYGFSSDTKYVVMGKLSAQTRSIDADLIPACVLIIAGVIMTLIYISKKTPQ